MNAERLEKLENLLMIPIVPEDVLDLDGHAIVYQESGFEDSVVVVRDGTEILTLSPNQAIRLGEWAKERQARYS